LGFDVHINDDDNGGPRDGKVSWHSTSDESWRDPSTFGSLRLTGTPPVPELPYASQAPAIDGDVGGDAAWDVWTGDPVALENLILGGTDVDASWRAAWDYDALYVGVEVAEGSAPVANSGQAYWEDDSVEVFVDMGFTHERVYNLSEFQYIFRAANPAFIGSRLAGSEGVLMAVSSAGAGYTMEMRIPWSQPAVQEEFALPGRRVGVGSAIGFDIHVNDDDPGTGANREGKLAWALSPFSGDVSWNTPQVFGRVTLGR
jgi:hypothetical protein